MLKMLEMIYSLPCLIGAVGWQIIWKLSLHSRARWLDVHHPLPDGQKHCVERMSRVWLAGLCAAFSVGYVLLATARAEEHTHELNRAVVHCWSESYQNTVAQIEINRQNDLVTRKQQDLQRQFDIDTSNWLKKLVSPPGDLASQPTNSPARQQYGIQVTTVYQAELDDLGRQFDDQVKQRESLDQQRKEHPLPEAKCGRTS